MPGLQQAVLDLVHRPACTRFSWAPQLCGKTSQSCLDASTPLRKLQAGPGMTQPVSVQLTVAVTEYEQSR